LASEPKGETVITRQTAWREIGDTTFEAFEVELARLDSPMLGDAAAIYQAARPHSRLVIAHSFAENKHDTVGILIKPKMKNFLALRPRRYQEETGKRNGFATFATYADCVAAWRRRHTDATIDTDKAPKNYTEAVSLLDYCLVYNPAGDTHDVTGLVNDPARYCDELLATINRLPGVQSERPLFTAFTAPRLFHVPHGARAVGRATPVRDPGNVVRVFRPEEAITCDGFFPSGEPVAGEPRWLRTSGPPHLAIHTSGLTEPI
jgi:hypothetical protein